MDGDSENNENNQFVPGLGQNMEDANAGLGAGGVFEGAMDDENVDQYFDDGGETFLPADHVRYKCLTL